MTTTTPILRAPSRTTLLGGLAGLATLVIVMSSPSPADCQPSSLPALLAEERPAPAAPGASSLERIGASLVGIAHSESLLLRQLGDFNGKLVGTVCRR